MGSTVKKIALLSGGGDCPGLNAVIRTITKTAISKYGYEVIGFVYGYRGLYHNNYVELTEESVEDIYKEITGKEMTKFYRPPQGIYSNLNMSMAKEMGYHTFFWSLAYVDWYQDKQPTKDEAFGKLLKRIHPGAIVLLHSTSSTNAQILDELLTKWEEMGYTIKPLTELAGAAT